MKTKVYTVVFEQEHELTDVHVYGTLKKAQTAMKMNMLNEVRKICAEKRFYHLLDILMGEEPLGGYDGTDYGDGVREMFIHDLSISVDTRCAYYYWEIFEGELEIEIEGEVT